MVVDDAADLPAGFYDNRGRFVVEPGQIDVFAGDSSVGGLRASLTIR